MRRTLLLLASGLALINFGCATSIVQSEIRDHGTPSLRTSMLTRCQLAVDSKGQARCVLRIRACDGRIQKLGDQQWFAEHPKAKLIPVALRFPIHDESTRPPRPWPSGEKGSFVDPTGLLPYSCADKDRAALIFETDAEGEFSVAVFLPPEGGWIGSEVTGKEYFKKDRPDDPRYLRGKRAWEMRGRMDFEGKWEARAMRGLLYPLLPLTFAFDVATAPIVIPIVVIAVYSAFG